MARIWTVLIAVLLLHDVCFADDDDIMFARRNFADGGESFVGISGTLTGNGIAYKNNTYAIACYRDYKGCFVAYIEQIGQKQIGRLEYPYVYPIVKWDSYEIVAAEETTIFGCSKTTITITRKSESALWVQEPINQTRPECAKSDTSIHKWTIEDSLGWKKLERR